MKRFNLAIVLGIFFIFSGITIAYEGTFTPPPAPRGEMARPPGAHCTFIPGRFRHGSYETAHLKCRKHDSVYVTGYFTCERSDFRHGRCRHWEWVNSHWVRK